MTQNSTNYNPTQYSIQIGSTNGSITGISPSTTTIPQIFTSNGASANPSFSSPSAYSFTMARQVLTSSGTYTPTTNMKYCIVECIGGGGGSANITASQGSTIAVQGGGAGGSYSRGYFSSASVGASQTVTIGAGGGAATTGGTTSLGSLITAPGGGAKGGISTAVNTIYVSSGAGAGTAGTGGSVLWRGNSGAVAVGAYVSTSAVMCSGGGGGSSFYGGGAQGNGTASNAVKVNGSAATSYGGGGGGPVMSSNTTANATPGSGFAGVVIITEFIYT